VYNAIVMEPQIRYVQSADVHGDATSKRIIRPCQARRSCPGDRV